MRAPGGLERNGIVGVDMAQQNNTRQVGMRAKEYLDLANNMHLFDDGTLESLRSARMSAPPHTRRTPCWSRRVVLAPPARVRVCAALRSRRRIKRHAKDMRACVRRFLS